MTAHKMDQGKFLKEIAAAWTDGCICELCLLWENGEQFPDVRPTVLASLLHSFGPYLGWRHGKGLWPDWGDVAIRNSSNLLRLRVGWLPIQPRAPRSGSGPGLPPTYHPN